MRGHAPFNSLRILASARNLLLCRFRAILIIIRYGVLMEDSRSRDPDASDRDRHEEFRSVHSEWLEDKSFQGLEKVSNGPVR